MRVLRNIYWPLVAPVLVLTIVSLTILSSINGRLFWAQAAWTVIGAGFFMFFAFFDWRPYVTYRWFIGGIYAALLSLLLLTYAIAPSIRGIRAWIVIGSFQIQTSEFAKVGLILVFAYFFGRHHLTIARLKTILYSFLLLLPPLGFVLVQPDLGSALVLGGLWFSLLLLSGLKFRHIAVAGVGFAVLAIIGWTFLLAPYQKERIIGLFDPSHDPLGVNYSVIQSKIAIGSGGLLGKGYGQGTQTQLGFLPEAANDFIFAALIEEWGLLTGMLVISTFIFLMYAILKVGILATTNFEKYITLGASTMIAIHFIINIGSTVGLLPVIGVPLPFVSAGGSNLLANMFLMAIIHSIALRNR